MKSQKSLAMNNEEREKLRERFMRDPLPRRLGGLAATLGRISSSARKSTDPNMVFNLLDEAKHLIEWTATETEPETAAELVRMQTMITLWQRAWEEASQTPNSASCFPCRQKIGLIRQWIFRDWFEKPTSTHSTSTARVWVKNIRTSLAFLRLPPPQARASQRSKLISPDGGHPTACPRPST
jgi:hypothetical protein